MITTEKYLPTKKIHDTDYMCVIIINGKINEKKYTYSDEMHVVMLPVLDKIYAKYRDASRPLHVCVCQERQFFLSNKKISNI